MVVMVTDAVREAQGPCCARHHHFSCWILGGAWGKGQAGREWVREGRAQSSAVYCLGEKPFQNLTTSLSTEWTWGEKGAVGIILITPQGKNEPSMKPVLDTET